MKNIVIVGGGVAGIGLAQALEKHKPALPSDVKIIVIDRRDYYYHIIAGLRAPVDAVLQEEATIPYDRVFKASSPASILQAEATSIDESFVHTQAADSGTSKIPYDLLVISTGSMWSQELNLPFARQEAIKKLASQGAEIAEAKKIIIVGGGAVGVELAGEIAEKYSGQKQKHVTLVHRGRALLNDVYPDKLRGSLKSQLESRGVDVLTGLSIDGELEAGEVTLSNGSRITCDLIYQTVGGRPNSDIVKSFDSGVIAENGSIKVEKSFQVINHPKIFAMGDVADLKEQKQAAKIGEHIPVVAMNLVSLCKESKLVSEYKGQKELIVVTVGRKGGAGWIMGWNVGSFVSSVIKSKGLFLSGKRKELGY